MSNRFASLALAVALAVALAATLAACGGGGGSPIPRRNTPPQPTGVPIPEISVPPTVTQSGLQMFDIQVGTGQEAQEGDIAYVTYMEWLSDGRFLDVTNVDGTPVPIRQILRQGQVIPGLLEGIIGMKVGGKRRVIVPPDLGYGDQWSGDNVPPNSTLIFDIDLVEIRRP